MISVGDHKSRKKDVLERMFRQELTSQAIQAMAKQKQKEGEKNGSLQASNANLVVPNPVNEKDEDSGVDGGEVERWSSAQEQQPQTSTTTTTTVAAPMITTTTTTSMRPSGH